MLKARHAVQVDVKTDGFSVLNHIKRVERIGHNAVVQLEALIRAGFKEGRKRRFRAAHADTGICAELLQRDGRKRVKRV